MVASGRISQNPCCYTERCIFYRPDTSSPAFSSGKSPTTNVRRGRRSPSPSARVNRERRGSGYRRSIERQRRSIMSDNKTGECYTTAHHSVDILNSLYGQKPFSLTLFKPQQFTLCFSGCHGNHSSFSCWSVVVKTAVVCRILQLSYCGHMP